MSKILIAFYSRKGENYVNGSIKDLKEGNTKIIAKMIADITGGDLFEMDTVKEYPRDYYECIEVAKDELRQQARPQLKEYLKDLDKYDTVFIGYPNWWGTMPMAVCEFLEHCNLSGKKILPFCTNEGSGMGKSESDLKKLCPGSKIEKGLSIHGAEAAESRALVEKWVQRSL